MSSQIAQILGSILLNYDDDNTLACNLYCDRDNANICIGYNISGSYAVNFWAGAINTKILCNESTDNCGNLTNLLNAIMNFKFSDFQNLPSFKNFETPFPIITSVISVNDLQPETAYQFEITPDQIGSLNLNNIGYLPIKFLNTKFNNGIPFISKNCSGDLCCWNGDTMPFLLAISGSAFEVDVNFFLYFNNNNYYYYLEE